jgi:hypothetical protein|tara:strand:- start:52 stop:939 length:888 start_codon:yes stop_codon:yes gene_type:complete
MSTFKDINKSSTIIEKNVVSYKHSFTTASVGIQSIKIVSGSINDNYWQSLNVMFYTSGSSVYGNETKLEFTNFAYKDRKQHLNKYHGFPSASLISIPQKYYGERIKSGSFKFTDLNNSDGSGNNPIIIDDGFGNLYSTNAHYSQSSNDASSSDNYVGNIFYEQGIAVLTETGSWSGSVDYSDLATNFTLDIESQDTNYTHEYEVTLKPNEFNHTMNYTVRMPIGTFPTLNDLTASILSNEYLASEFTSSDWQPYITRIHLYQEGDYDTPVMTANLVKPIRKSDKIPITFKIKLDM